MKPNIFHSTSLKLASFYLLIIMLISLLFSISFYRVATEEIARPFRPPGPVRTIVMSGGNGTLEQFVIERDEVIASARQRLLSTLVLLNAFIAIGGGFLSYYLARRSLQPIEEAHEAQSRFTADASHELRTPITAMRAETELTFTEPKLTLTQARSQLESNIEELDKLTALSDGLLRLARLDNNGLEFRNELLKDAVNDAVGRVEQAAKQKQQTIKATGIPKIELRMNRESLTEAFVTVLENAVKYSPDKSTVVVTAEKKAKSIEIRIIDKGIGIDEDDLPHIFERFYRADKSRSKGETNGYGIGLSIAKATAEAHSGIITAISRPGKGSTFIFTLPIS